MNSLLQSIQTYVSDETQSTTLAKFINDTYNGIKLSKPLVIYGSGNNGKTTFANKVFSTFADKAVSFPSNSLTSGSLTYLDPHLADIEKRNLLVVNGLEGNLNPLIINHLISSDDLKVKPLYNQSHKIENNANILFVLVDSEVKFMNDIEHDLIHFDKTF